MLIFIPLRLSKKKLDEACRMLATSLAPIGQIGGYYTGDGKHVGFVRIGPGSVHSNGNDIGIITYTRLKKKTPGLVERSRIVVAYILRSDQVERLYKLQRLRQNHWQL